MAPVILINPFEVAAGREDEFVRLWEAAAAYMQRQPGYVSTRLHRALLPNARFAFVNVGEFESPDQFLAAISTDEFQQLAGAMSDFPAAPALYEVVREHHT